METLMIIVMAVGVVAVIVSFCVTAGEKTGDQITPGVPDELTDADKDKLADLMDAWIREYGKKKVKEQYGKAIEQAVQERSRKLDSREENLEKQLTEKADTHFDEYAERLGRNKKEADRIYEMITTKEKDMQVSLRLVDEYKASLEKMRDSLESSGAELSEKAGTESRETGSGQAPEAAEESEENRESVQPEEPEAPAESPEAPEPLDAHESEDIPAESPASADVPPETRGETSEKQETEDIKEEHVSGEKAGKKKRKNRRNRKKATAEKPAEQEDLSDIMEREGIRITDGDTRGNVMEMYHAGFSMIEISKVMKLDVSQVKDVIDEERGEQE